MRRIITLTTIRTNETNKYKLIKEYEGYGVYKEICPSGYFVSQSWLLVEPTTGYKIICPSYNNYVLDELLDCIDSFKEAKQYCLKGFDSGASFTVHPGGNKEI